MNGPNGEREKKRLIESLPAPDGPEELVPCVRYGKSDNTQLPTLRRVTEPPPGDVITSSPIFYLTQRQLKKQARFDHPWNGEEDSIALQLQDEAIHHGRVRYPVNVESDSLDDGVPLDEIVDVISAFVNGWLRIPPEQGTWWYSGNRSIHFHAPFFVRWEELTALKKHAERFNRNADTDVSLDTSIYSSNKGQFRLPNVDHKAPGAGVKVEIEPDWGHDRIFRASRKAEPDPPESYVEALAQTRIPPIDASVPGILTHDEQREERDQLHDHSKRNPHHFSPYANAKEGAGHSIAAFTVRGEPTSVGGETFVPAKVHGAVGADGEYEVRTEERPVKLSARDRKKIEWREGEDIVQLGGGSRSSIIHQPDYVSVVYVAKALTEAGRPGAKEALEELGYDTGETGKHGPRRQESPFGQNSGTTEPLRRRAEDEGIQALDRTEQIRIAIGLLQAGGWENAWEWFRRHYHDEFDPELTYSNLRELVDGYDDLADVDVPPP